MLPSRRNTRPISFAKTAIAGGLALALTSFAAGTPALAWEMRVCADPGRFPFSDRERGGFEIEIAEIIADELDADLVIEWWPNQEALVPNALRPGRCDVVIGMDAGTDNALTTFAYYRSPFVFVYRANEGYDIRTFDDPILHELRVGVQPTFGPTHQALLKRDITEIEEFNFVYGGADDPLAPIVEAVANGDIDVGAIWGPAGGYYAARQDVALIVQPVPPFEPPLIPMYVNIGIGVRLGDEALRDRIDIALANRWEEIYAVLEEYNVPTLPLPRPTPTIEVTQ